MTSQDVVALLVPLVTAAAGAGAIAMQDRRVRRSGDEQHRIAFEDAIRRVTFTTQWLEARRSLDVADGLRTDDEQVALGWLEDASAVARTKGAVTATEADTRSLFSRLFLLHRMTRPAAKAVRVAFYLPVLFVGWIALVALGEVLSGKTYADQASWEVTGSIVGVLCALAMRGWVLALDHHAGGPTDRPAGAASSGS